MAYLIGIVAGFVASVIALFIFAAVMASRLRAEGQFSEVAINILAPLPLAIALTAFAVGFFLVIIAFKTMAAK